MRKLEEIETEVEEQAYDYVDRLAKVSDDTKSLLVRIPQEIRNKFNLSAGDKLRFHGKPGGKGPRELKIEIIKNVKQNR